VYRTETVCQSNLFFYCVKVELLIPELQFLNEEGAQAEVWELSRVFLETLMEETGGTQV
jgi:hypothetical protein